MAEPTGIDQDEAVHSEEPVLNRATHPMERSDDPVRMYLRHMSVVPLLTREREVAIAQRMERGQRLVLKTISRFPIVLKELMTMGASKPH